VRYTGTGFLYKIFCSYGIFRIQYLFTHISFYYFLLNAYSRLLGASIDVEAVESAIAATSRRLGHGGGMRAGDLADALQSMDVSIDAARAELIARAAGALSADGSIKGAKVAQYLHDNGGLTMAGGIRTIRRCVQSRSLCHNPSPLLFLPPPFLSFLSILYYLSHTHGPAPPFPRLSPFHQLVWRRQE
jgi:hypothetical protein